MELLPLTLGILDEHRVSSSPRAVAHSAQLGTQKVQSGKGTFVDCWWVAGSRTTPFPDRRLRGFKGGAHVVADRATNWRILPRWIVVGRWEAPNGLTPTPLPHLLQQPVSVFLAHPRTPEPVVQPRFLSLAVVGELLLLAELWVALVVLSVLPSDGLHKGGSGMGRYVVERAIGEVGVVGADQADDLELTLLFLVPDDAGDPLVPSLLGVADLSALVVGDPDHVGEVIEGGDYLTGVALLLGGGGVAASLDVGLGPRHLLVTPLRVLTVPRVDYVYLHVSATLTRVVNQLHHLRPEGGIPLRTPADVGAADFGPFTLVVCVTEERPHTEVEHVRLGVVHPRLGGERPEGVDLLAVHLGPFTALDCAEGTEAGGLVGPDQANTFSTQEKTRVLGGWGRWWCGGGGRHWRVRRTTAQ